MHHGSLTPRQHEFLMTVARARTETLLRWSFYFRPAAGVETNDWFGHPDLYGHDLPVDGGDIRQLVSLGLLTRLTHNPDGFLDEYEISKAGMALYRWVTLWHRARKRTLLTTVLAALIALALALL